MLYLGRDLVDWLLEHVEDLRDRKAARQYAADLLKNGLIRHVVSKLTFTEKCYYVFGDAVVGVRGGADSTQTSGGTIRAEATTEVTYVGSPAPGVFSLLYFSGKTVKVQLYVFFLLSITNDYASMVGVESSTSYAMGVGRGMTGAIWAPPPNTPLSNGSGVLSNLAPPHPSPCETEFEDDDKRRILRK
uniref:DEP domain-containing protein n=1 Tax=Heterorhabditis bacteriophora TaxID=37862 RepID=A0A1I7X0M3_HETBA